MAPKLSAHIIVGEEKAMKTLQTVNADFKAKKEGLTTLTRKDSDSTNYRMTDFLAQDSIGKAMWKLMYPSLIAKVVSSLYIISDSVFIGQLAGNTEQERITALSAISVAMPLEQGVIFSLVMMVNSGGSILYSQSVGEQNNEKGKKAIGNTYFLEFTVALILTTIFPFLSKPLLRLIGSNEEAGTLPLGDKYIKTLLFGSFCCAISMASIDLIRGQGSALLSCFVSVISTVCNIVGDPLCIRVFNLGVMGAALSRVLADFVSGLLGICIMHSKRAVVRFDWSDLKPDWKMGHQIMVTGISGLVSGFAGAFVTVISNMLVLHYSKYPQDSIETMAVLSAWGAMSKVYFVSFMPLIALAQGVIPLLAYSYGAKLYTRFIHCSQLMFFWEIGISIVMEVFILVLAPWIGTWFSQEKHFLQFFIPALRIMVSGMFLQPLVLSLFPMLQSIGKGGLGGILLAMKACIIPLVLQLSISWVIDDYWGAVYSYPITEFLSALFAVFLFYKNRSVFEGPPELSVTEIMV